MGTIEDRIERARLEREAQERRAARRSHPGAEDSDPPSWPPRPIQGRRGDGNPHLNLEATHKSFVGVWGILAVIGAAGGIGFLTSAAFNGTAKKETTDQIQKDLAKLSASQEKNQAIVETNLNTMKTDIQQIKDALHIAQQPLPLTPEKKPTPEKPHR